VTDRGRATDVAKEFKGEITLDVRESTPDRSAFLYDIADDAYIDVEKHLAAALARD
jgi:hypothetical protein